MEKLDGEQSLETLRAGLEVDKGRAGNFESKEAIPQIWNLIENQSGGLTRDQFFGIQAIDQDRPTFLGIIAAHTILNVVGFRSDRKLARPAALPGIMSDGSHMAHAAFCHVLMSADRRMCDKASAIYKHLGLETVVARLDIAKRSWRSRAA